MKVNGIDTIFSTKVIKVELKVLCSSQRTKKMVKTHFCYFKIFDSCPCWHLALFTVVRVSFVLPGSCLIWLLSGWQFPWWRYS